MLAGAVSLRRGEHWRLILQLVHCCRQPLQISDTSLLGREDTGMYVCKFTLWNNVGAGPPCWLTSIASRHSSWCNGETDSESGYHQPQCSICTCCVISTVLTCRWVVLKGPHHTILTCARPSSSLPACLATCLRLVISDTHCAVGAGLHLSAAATCESSVATCVCVCVRVCVSVCVKALFGSLVYMYMYVVDLH